MRGVADSSCERLLNTRGWHPAQWLIQNFSEMGLPTPGGQGSQTYDFAKCSQKLHEIERIWALRGGASPKFYYVDPPLQLIRCCPLSTRLISLFMHINEQG